MAAVSATVRCMSAEGVGMMRKLVVRYLFSLPHPSPSLPQSAAVSQVQEIRDITRIERIGVMCMLPW